MQHKAGAHLWDAAEAAVAHEYGEIDYEILWRATTTEIPTLIPILDQLVDEARGALGL